MPEFDPTQYDENRTDLAHISPENLAKLRHPDNSSTQAKALEDEIAERQARPSS